MGKKRTGPKGPRTDRKILDRLIALALDQPELTGRQIRDKLLEQFKEFEDIDIPSIRTVQDYMKSAREQAIENAQEQAWSLGLMARKDTGIPWEAVYFLLETFEELRCRQKRGEKFWYWSGYLLDHVYKGTASEVVAELKAGREPEHISAESLPKALPPRTLLTVRQAKWLWRMHLILPASLSDRFRQICEGADQYAHRELLADYLNDPFDTRDLDDGLILQLKIEGEKKRKKKKKEEE